MTIDQYDNIMAALSAFGVVASYALGVIAGLK